MVTSFIEGNFEKTSSSGDSPTYESMAGSKELLMANSKFRSNAHRYKPDVRQKEIASSTDARREEGGIITVLNHHGSLDNKNQQYRFPLCKLNSKEIRMMAY